MAICNSLSAPLNLATAQAALSELLRHSAPTLSVEEVLKKACDLFGMSPKSLKEKSRCRAVSHPRMLVLYLARKHSRGTYSDIGRRIADVNHSTVIAAEKKMLSQINKDGEIVLGHRPWKVRDAVEAFDRELGRG